MSSLNVTHADGSGSNVHQHRLIADEPLDPDTDIEVHGSLVTVIQIYQGKKNTSLTCISGGIAVHPLIHVARP